MIAPRLLALALFASTTCAHAAPVIDGCPVLPANNVWNARVDRLPVHPSSTSWVANVAIGGGGATRAFHMDFGSGLWDGAPIGIPYVLVSASQPKVPVSFDYADESDPGPYPIPPNAPIEGVGPPTADGDRHVLVVDRDNCVLYETFHSFPLNGGASWTAGSGAVYDLRSNALRPSGWTSADAAGLPILPGLARYDEVAAGVIEHALRFTAQRTQRAFVWPARHFASSITDGAYPPMGARFRLKASYDISGFSPQARVIAQAMKTYGIMLADNGSPWYVSGAPDERWDNDALHELDLLRGSDFEAVDTSSLMVDPNSGQFALPRFNLGVWRGSPSLGEIASQPLPLTCGETTCRGTFDTGTSITISALPEAGNAFSGWSGACSGTAPCALLMDRDRAVTAMFRPAAERLALSLDAVGFGGQSMGTTSPMITVTVANLGTVTRNVTGVAVTGTQFSQTNNCGAVPPGGSCLVEVAFAAAIAPGALHTAVTANGSLAVTGDGAVETNTIPLSGDAEKSLVSHYYRAILDRAPDTAGKNFWIAEASRLAAGGANVNETWFVMASYFFNSPEYSSYQKTDAQFVADLYNAFFNRAPDAGGLSFWSAQIAAGLPREVALTSFMFSPEFRSFTEAIFGNTAARPEVDMVMDLFRGILNRLPDSAALDFWLGQLRTAQCQGAGAVYGKVDEMSYFFIFSPEYANRGRTNSQYVGDLYNAFLRRGGDSSGVQYWIDQLDSNARSRNTVRNNFIASPEFGARVNAVIAAGCTS